VPPHSELSQHGKLLQALWQRPVSRLPNAHAAQNLRVIQESRCGQDSLGPELGSVRWHMEGTQVSEISSSARTKEMETLTISRAKPLGPRRVS
jgi:hypothetical protein